MKTSATGKELQARIERFSTILDAFPAGFQGNRLNLVFLGNAHPILDGRGYLRMLDAPQLQEERREFLLDQKLEWPFPTIRIDTRPDPMELSAALFENFECAPSVLPTQHDIGALLVERALAMGVDIVVLMIVDGFSYYDLPASTIAEPCLVHGVTITDFGYRQVIGKPSISQRLFSNGFRHQLALTFFDKENTSLSQDLHAAFGSSQVHRINSIEEGISIIKHSKMRHGYIQIIAPGLDHLSHYHADRPPQEEYVKQIMERFCKVFDWLSRKRGAILAGLTADHGILWREQIEDKVELVDELFPDQDRSPRYAKGRLLRGNTRIASHGGHSFTLLRAPCMTRKWRHSEWGVHGGISAWESIVPLILYHK